MSAKEVLLTRTGGWPGKGWPKDELVRYVPAEPLEAENARLRKAIIGAFENIDAGLYEEAFVILLGCITGSRGDKQ